MSRVIWITFVLLSLGSQSVGVLEKTTESQGAHSDTSKQTQSSKQTVKDLLEGLTGSENKDSDQDDSVSEQEKKQKSEKVSKTTFIDSDDEEIGYFSDGDSIGAVVPTFENYNQEDAIAILGEPTTIMSDVEGIRTKLEADGAEFERIMTEFKAGHLTESQAKAFAFQAFDISAAIGMRSEAVGLIYDDPQKPNVYLLDGQVAYVTPIVTYMEFKGKISQP